jgi:hypothetical protein
MALTPAQLTTLKAAIDADPVLAAKPLNSDGDFDIAQILNNTQSAPDFYVWKTSISVNEIMGNGFDWTRVDNMVVGEARIWDFMTKLGFINPNQSNVRAGINEAFKGTAQDNTMRLAIYGHCQRLAMRTQRIFATGSGVTSDDLGVGPGTVVVESITPNDVHAARAL